MSAVSAPGISPRPGAGRFRSDDAVRAWVIERLMCDFSFSVAALEARFGDAAAEVIAEGRALVNSDLGELLAPSDDGFRLTERARPFVRAVCARFDAYLREGSAGATHSLAV